MSKRTTYNNELSKVHEKIKMIQDKIEAHESTKGDCPTNYNVIEMQHINDLLIGLNTFLDYANQPETSKK